MLSKINYIISSIGLPEKVLKQANRILFRFLWKKKFSNTRAFEKIKRKVLCSDTKNRGLNMFDISQIQSVAFLQWAEAVCTRPEEDWKTIAFQTLRPVTDKAVFLSSSRTIKGINRVKNQFWKRVLETWATFNKHREPQDFMKKPIFKNKFLTYQRISLR